MAWQKGQSGNPGGKLKNPVNDPLRPTQPDYTRLQRRKIYIPALERLDLEQLDHGKQATHVRNDAYRFARLLGRNILRALRADNQKGLRDIVIQWGIAADKVLQHAESEGLSLFVPSALLDKLMLAVQIKDRSTPPPPVVALTQLPLGDDTHSTPK